MPIMFARTVCPPPPRSELSPLLPANVGGLGALKRPQPPKITTTTTSNNKQQQATTKKEAKKNR